MSIFNQDIQDLKILPNKKEFGNILKEIKKDSRSLKNRFQSILSDSKFVQEVGEAYDLPLIGKAFLFFFLSLIFVSNLIFYS